MNSWYEKHTNERLPIGYLVYYYKGDIKVKRGYVSLGGNFYPENEDKWHTHIPSRSMQVSSKGRVICWRAEDIPEARQMIREHYLQKVNDVVNISITALNNIKKMIDEEDKQMIEYENNCVQCEDCRHCGRDRQKIGRCEDCGEKTMDLWYGNDGGQYCKYCITGYLEKVVIE